MKKREVRRPAALVLAAVCAAAFSLPAAAVDSDSSGGFTLLLPVESINAAIDNIAGIRDDIAAVRDDLSAIREMLEMQPDDSGVEALEVEPEPSNDSSEEHEEEEQRRADMIGDSVVGALIDYGVLVQDDESSGELPVYGVRSVRDGESIEEPTEETSVEPTEELSAEPTDETSAEPTEELSAEPTEELSAEPTEETSAEPTEELSADVTEYEPTQREMLSQIHTDIMILVFSVWGAALMMVGLHVGRVWFPIS